MKLRVTELNAESFKEFGQVSVVPPVSKPEHSCDEYDWWPDVMVFDSIKKNYAVGFSKIKKTPLRQTCSERHMETPECLVAVDGDMYIIVGPADYPDEPERLPDLSRFRAFKVKAGEAILMKPGVWHYACIPLKEEMYMYCIFSTETGDKDCYIVDFPDDAALEIEE